MHLLTDEPQKLKNDRLKEEAHIAHRLNTTPPHSHRLINLGFGYELYLQHSVISEDAKKET